MIDFSGLRADRWLGRVLRVPLGWIPPKAIVPVLQGKLRGTRWIVGSSVHGCWLGSYEHDKQRAIAQLLHEGEVFYDVGANVGFYSLLASRCVGPSGRVHAFEPLPANLRLLRRHIELNRAHTVEVHDLAVADREGVAQFHEASSRSAGGLSEDGTLEVKTTSLDSLVAGGLAPPTVLKIDVEGAEAAVLRGAMTTLELHRPVVFVATHGDTPHRESLELFAQADYRAQGLAGTSPHTTDELEAYPR